MQDGLTGSHRIYAQLVRGKDRGGHFDLLPERPSADLAAEAVALHEAASAQFLTNYHEQEKLHLAQYAGAANA